MLVQVFPNFEGSQNTAYSCFLLSFAYNLSQHGSQGWRKETRTACQEGSRKEVKRWQKEGFQEGRGKLQDLHLQGSSPTDLDVVPAIVVGRLCLPVVVCNVHSLSKLGLCAGAEASSPRHWNLFQGHVHSELFHR